MLPRTTDKALPTRSSFPRRRESSLFQRGMDSGSALRFARNDGFGQSPNQSRQPTNPSAPGIAKRHRPDGPRPERRSLSVAPKRTSPQGPQRCRMAGTQIPPSMTGLSACPTHHRPADNRSCQPLPASHPGNLASRPRADPIRAQFGPADSQHCHASLTGLAPNWTELDLTSFTSLRLSQPRTNALALRTHFSRHDKHPFFANIRRPQGPDAPPP